MLSLPLAALLVLGAPEERASSSQDARALTTEQRVDAIFERWNKLDSPCAAVAVVKGDKIVLARGYGCADLEHKIPITPSTVFELGSMSKQFTAMAIVLLAEKGALQYDDDVRKYIPELPDYGAKITLRNLLWHTSGLRELWFLWELAGWRWQDVITKNDMLGMAARQKSPDSPPRMEHAYRNTGYFLLALVVERVSGESFAGFCKENIFAPLGMEHTLIRDDHTCLIPNRAMSYHHSGDRGFTRSESNVESFGDTNAWSTVEDLAKWEMNLADCRVGGKAGIAEMVTAGHTDDGKTFPYGFGLRVGTDRGLSAVWHGGAAYGWRTEAIRYPDHELAAIVLCNSSDMDMSELARKVADVFLPGSAVKPPAPVAMRLQPPSETGRKLENLSEAAGTYYASTTQSLWRIESRDGALSVTITDGTVVPLTRMKGNRFRLGADPPRGIVEFESGGAADAWRMHGQFGEEKRAFERVELAKTDGGALAAYAGRYRNDEVRATFELVATSQGIVLRRDRFDDVLLTPYFAGAFKNDWLGVLRMTRDASGALSGFTISNRVRGVERIVFRQEG
jgi:CubicO group peptidase (beta-lactamase class C family)